MLTKRMVGGAALVLSMSAAIRVATAQAHNKARQAGAEVAVPAPGSAREAWFAGQRAGRTEDRRRHFGSGVQAARARLQADADDPEGLLWLAANLGAEALERGKLVALRVIPEMERLLLTLEARAPDYDHAAAARTLATLYHKAPPIISIGSNKKARAFWELALGRAPDYPPNLVMAAEFFADDGDRGRAGALARRYLQRPMSEQEHPEAATWRKLAERLAGQGR
jgi:hypothetical protein